MKEKKITIEDVSVDLKGLKTTVGGLTGKVDVVSDKVDVLANKVDVVATGLISVGKKVEDLADLVEKGFIHTEGRFDVLDAEISRANTTLEVHTHNFEVMKEWRNVSEKVADKTYQKIDDLKRRMKRKER